MPDPTPPDDELAKRRAAKAPATGKGSRAGRPKPGTKRGRKESSSAGSTSGAKQITAKQRQADAVSMRLAGASLTAIAGQLGYADASGARYAIMAALSEMLPDETRDEARRIELATLNRLQVANFPAALSGDDKAAAIVLRCIAMRSKLQGLEAPVQLDVRVREGELVRVEYLELINEETLAALKPFQDEMVRVSELRAGAIELEPGEVVES